ncbi:probable acyl-activating enzyme 16, chloroplastic isoform X2 [Dendrobium catenatum]|uniref:Putative acyl-activating enzyme 16, chloroplastic n=2 Tax=Dendrobium catenatum TaxID=906689 RepID=A0A2I0WY59_9ASPA|nr:probable acyl-activating enzyme 16, chloroplastic isoform X2 [Dendrobium catenatum]PKU80593.1 putative acyl-activating enzyme 16, chloroplastic [Dendrobium catenatum]
MEAKRICEGKVLTRKKNQDPPIVALLCNLWGRVVAAILWPFHILGMKLVFCQMRSAIGISKAGISGGGSLPLHIDKFFEAIGVKLQNGYGLTETSPVVACRRPDNIVLGTVGYPLNFTEIMIVDLETGRPLPDGSKGIVKVRGPQVMNGYYKNESATGEAIDEDGWFNSGDIGWIVPKHSTGMSRQCGGMLVLEGRAKDTIVLSTGENVEPSGLEEAVMRSNLIQHILVVGQDQRRLGALIVPNRDELLLAAKNRLLINDENSELSKDKMISLLHEEVRNRTKDCSFHIGPITIVDEPFTVENGLMTPTMKVRRDKVIDLYKVEIANLFK